MAELKPFQVAVESVADHFDQVEAVLRRHVDRSAKPVLGREQVGDLVMAGLEGDGLESTMRNRGAQTVRLAPLAPVRDGLWAWLGYREEWSRAPGGGTPRLFFRSSSITVHFGFKDTDPKPQMFRAEWAGLDLRGGKYQFQGGNAGHPHWQFDAIESLVRIDDGSEAAELAAILRQEAGLTKLRDFAPASMDDADVRKLVAARKIEAIHFASAATWWREDAATHAHLPRNAADIRTWVGKTLQYVSEELQRV